MLGPEWHDYWTSKITIFLWYFIYIQVKLSSDLKKPFSVNINKNNFRHITLSVSTVSNYWNVARMRRGILICKLDKVPARDSRDSLNNDQCKTGAMREFYHLWNILQMLGFLFVKHHVARLLWLYFMHWEGGFFNWELSCKDSLFICKVSCTDRDVVFASSCITWLFAYCKGGNFNIHIWAWFSYFIC